MNSTRVDNSSRVIVLQLHTYVHVEAWAGAAQGWGKVSVQIQAGQGQHVVRVRFGGSVTMVQSVEFCEVVDSASNAGVIVVCARVEANFLRVPCFVEIRTQESAKFNDVENDDRIQQENEEH